MPDPSKSGERIYEAFHQAKGLPDVERDALLARLGLTPEELAEVRLLLGSLREQGTGASPISEMVGQLRSDVLAATTTAAELPASIGSYRVVSRIGEGGMGVVYLARQSKPDRQVALKLIRPGFASARMLKRFEYEAEVLGRLLHPGIAQIYEAGMADLGSGPQPFFAMELVEGVTLTRFAKEKDLGTRARLELFAKICDAVQHAHQKGVIHRDLKPGNILVTADGQPKILDFGVARTTDGDIQNTTLQTDIGQLIGTLPYMSPEQVGGKPEDLDTRSDVYALGVVLYELLVGRLPYTLEKRLIHEAARIIKEEEPTRLSSIDRTLRGDVETIVGHALEKDKTRRYQGASSLAADIRRYLSDEPIAARPAGTWYQLRKFSQRNKALVGGVVVALVLLTAGVLGTALALRRALKAETSLKTQLTETNRLREAEKERADQLKKVSDFQSQMLGQIDTKSAGEGLMADVRERFAAALEKAGVPEADRGAQAKTLADLLIRVNATDTAAAMIDRTILRPAIKTIDEQFKDDPATDASLRQALADLYRTVGLYDAAFPLQESALATRRRLLGEEHPETLISINEMGTLLKSQGKLAEAEPYHREALEKCRRVLGEEHHDTLGSISNMGALLQSQGKLAEAEPYHREALEKCRRVLGEEHPDTLTSINNMGFLLLDQGKLDQAEPYYREALEKSRRVLGEEHPDTLISIVSMGALLQSQGKRDQAVPYAREAVEKSRRVLGEEHPDTLRSINNMGSLLRSQGKLAEAEPYYREALEKRRRVLGNEHPGTLTSISNMGSLLQSQGKLDEAVPYAREALEKSRRVLGEEHTDTLRSINNMGSLLRSQGKLAEAEPYYREALEKRRRVSGEEHPGTLTSISNMGALLQSQGKLDEAEPYYREALEKRRRVLGEEHPETLTSINNLGGLMVSQGKLPEAELYFQEALKKCRRVLGEEHPNTLGSISNMGVLLQSQGKLPEAELYFQEALEKCRRVLGEEHPDTLDSAVLMARLKLTQKAAQEALDLITRYEPAARKQFTGGNARRLADFLTALGRARVGVGFDAERFKLAEANLLEAHPIYVAAKDPGPTHKDTLACVQALIDLYTAWDKAEPGKGYEAKAAEWKGKLDDAAKAGAVKSTTMEKR